MSPFEPLGEEPRWKVLYQLLKGTPTGAIVTYEAMAGALGLDSVRHRSAMASAMRRAADEHEEKDKRAVEVVRNEGYRIVDAGGHLRLAHVHGRRAGAQLEMAYSKVTNVDLSGADPEVRKGFEVVARGFMEQMEINRRLSARQRRTEKTLDVVMERGERTDEEIAELKRRLAAIEGEPEAAG